MFSGNKIKLQYSLVLVMQLNGHEEKMVLESFEALEKFS